MILHLLIAAQCFIKEPARTFQLTCKSEVVRFYSSEKECKANETSTQSCIEVRIGK